MKPTDLRIGCFVKLRDTGEIVRVGGLTKRKIGFHTPNAHLRYRRYSEIEPVPIREVYNSLPSIPDLMWADKANCEELYYYGDLIITDLHDLQNAYFVLMGDELKIEL